MKSLVAAIVVALFSVAATTMAASPPAPSDEPAPSTRPERAAWLRDARLGVMTHYLPDWIEKKQWTADEFNALIDGFDVDALAAQLESVGCKYYLFTIGQNSGFYNAPNATYDEIVGHKPSHCARRDLISDLSTALKLHGIKLMVYLPAGAPSQDKIAREKLQWTNGPHRNAEFQRNWERIIKEWSDRWGTNVSGWWFDGCYWPNHMYRGDAPNFESFAAAARSGNPDAIVAFNPGVFFPIFSMSAEEDYTAGEINDVERTLIKTNRLHDGQMDGSQLHMLSYLGKTWGRGDGPRLSNERATAITQDFINHRGVVTWDTPVQRNGTIAEPFMQQLRVLSRDVKPATQPTTAPAPR
ncbi:MAG: hypothetical protein QOE14_2741 [Humisphaera sp.]|nr:hypothetical protein [Humisphaera sp.]